MKRIGLSAMLATVILGALIIGTPQNAYAKVTTHFYEDISCASGVGWAVIDSYGNNPPTILAQGCWPLF